MNIQHAKKTFQRQWILAQVIKKNKLGQPTEIEVIAHNKDRAKIYDLLDQIEDGTHVTTFFAGPMPKNYAIAF